MKKEKVKAFLRSSGYFINCNFFICLLNIREHWQLSASGTTLKKYIEEEKRAEKL